MCVCVCVCVCVRVCTRAATWVGDSDLYKDAHAQRTSRLHALIFCMPLARHA